MRNKWDERASDSFKKFELEEEFKEEMGRRKTQYSTNQSLWMVAIDMTLLVLIGIPFVYLIMLITR